MATFRERWRAGRSAFIVLVGCAIAFGGNVALIASVFLASRSGLSVLPAGLAVLGAALSIITGWIVAAHPPGTAKRFAMVAVVTSAIVLLNVPGLVGGAVALVGAILGTLARYEGLPERTRA